MSTASDERILIACDRVSAWRSKNLWTCVKTIGSEQSCWAHPPVSNGEDVDVIGVSQPSLMVHALSMYVLREHYSGREDKPRTKIQGLGFDRPVVEEHIVESPQPHLITGLDNTHRDLRFSDDHVRHATVERMANSDSKTIWKFTAGELVPLLRRALQSGVVTAKYEATAKQICRQFSI